jgi:hypothetical protein
MVHASEALCYYPFDGTDYNMHVNYIEKNVVGFCLPFDECDICGYFSMISISSHQSVERRCLRNAKIFQTF